MRHPRGTAAHRTVCEPDGNSDRSSARSDARTASRVDHVSRELPVTLPRRMKPLRRTARASAEPLSRALLSRSGLIQALMSCVRLRADPCAVRLLGERTAGVRPNRSQTHAADHRRPTPDTPRERSRPTRCPRLRTRRQALYPRRQRYLAPYGAGPERPSRLRSLRPRKGGPELGYVSLHELAAARGPLGLPLERDLHFEPTRTLSAYAELAREHRRIIT